MRCPSCGEKVSRSDETCWRCGTILRYEEPRGTLQDEIIRGSKPRQSIDFTKALISIAVIIMVTILTAAAVLLIQEEEISIPSGRMVVVDYTCGEVDDSIWFAVYIKNAVSYTHLTLPTKRIV